MEIGTHAVTAFSDVNELLGALGFCKSLNGEFSFG